MLPTLLCGEGMFVARSLGQAPRHTESLSQAMLMGDILELHAVDLNCFFAYVYQISGCF